MLLIGVTGKIKLVLPENVACFGLVRFGFDLIYGGDSEQVSVWKDVGVPALEKAFAGQSGCWVIGF